MSEIGGEIDAGRIDGALFRKVKARRHRKQLAADRSDFQIEASGIDQRFDEPLQEQNVRVQRQNPFGVR